MPIVLKIRTAMSGEGSLSPRMIWLAYGTLMPAASLNFVGVI